MDLQVVADGRFQFFHTSKDSATYALIRDFCEPTLHEIDPGTISGREVEVKVRAFGKPVPNQRCFVRAVVIEHDMNVKLGGGRPRVRGRPKTTFMRAVSATNDTRQTRCR